MVRKFVRNEFSARVSPRSSISSEALTCYDISRLVQMRKIDLALEVNFRNSFHEKESKTLAHTAPKPPPPAPPPH